MKEGFLSGTVKITNVGPISIQDVSLEFLIDDTAPYWDANFLSGDSLTEELDMDLGIIESKGSLEKKYSWDLKNRVPDLPQSPFKVNFTIVPRYHVRYSQVTAMTADCRVS